MAQDRLGTVVMKFGGTSVGTPEAIADVVRIAQDARAQHAECVVLVVSAMSKVTDALQRGIAEAALGSADAHHRIAEELLERHRRAADELAPDNGDLMDDIAGLFDEYTRFGDGVYILGEATPRALDYTMGLGERMSARLVAAAINAAGLRAEAVDATDLIVTDAHFQNAAPLMDATRTRVQRNLVPLLEEGLVPVVTGFIGATKEGVSTTLGRGGSDYSAAIFGACLDADEVWIWTDVDGVMSTDPRIVPEARTIDTLTHIEIGELAYFGAKVLHPKTIRPTAEAGIPVRVKNTFNPDHPGTLIVPNGHGDNRRIKAVTAIRDMSLLTIEGKGMMGVPGIAARTFAAVAETQTSVLIISQASSEQSICFVIPTDSSEQVTTALNAEFAREIARRDIDTITADDDITIITVVGAGMRETPGIAGRIFTATGSAGINVIAIAQGSSECGISLVVSAEQADGGLRAIHPLTLED